MAGLELNEDAISSEMTILKLRRFLEQHSATVKILKNVDAYIGLQRFLFRQGAIIDRHVYPNPIVNQEMHREA